MIILSPLVIAWLITTPMQSHFKQLDVQIVGKYKAKKLELAPSFGYR